LIFFVLAFFIIPYSNGWRFNFSTFNLEKLGGLYLNVEPTEASVQVDKLNFEIKSSFMKSGILIANLFPKTYHIYIHKDGYQPWNKNLSVKPSLVTQTYPIILIPEKSNEEILESKVKDFFPNTNYLTWKDTNNKLRIDGKIIKGSIFWAWLTGERSALVYDESSKNYLVINAAQNNSALNISLLFENLKYQQSINDNNSIKKVIGHPLDKNKLILATNKNLYILDFYKPSLEIIKSDKNNNNLLSASGEEIFFTDSTGLYCYDLNKNKVSLLVSQSKINSMEISPNNQFIAFSSDNNKLVLLNRSKNENNLTDLVNDPAYFKFSPDSKKIAAVYDNNKIKILFIGDDYELFNKKIMGSSSFEINSMDTNLPIIWHSNSYYLFVKSGTALKFLEINDDLPINLQTIDAAIDNYFYSNKENKIYLIKSNSLFEIIE
jgi:hypothetical protein